MYPNFHHFTTLLGSAPINQEAYFERATNFRGSSSEEEIEFNKLTISQLQPKPNSKSLVSRKTIWRFESRELLIKYLCSP